MPDILFGLENIDSFVVWLRFNGTISVDDDAVVVVITVVVVDDDH